MPMPKDCLDVKDLGGGRDGIYTIFPTYTDSCEGVKVWCDQSMDGGGWLVSWCHVLTYTRIKTLQLLKLFEHKIALRN